ncbi:hypothetical protein RE6C_01380 [Rhodopirellula europaea 6C]|uniref:Uncharacterized protein n=1 Tax=Rhodopirellula europaea 6C TaxID=1263867 RepID=M2B6S9_9BACT|nr:hypothetical protein RE6C_01380 [Rhodopirellula europaea 6C]
MQTSPNPGESGYGEHASEFWRIRLRRTCFRILVNSATANS